MLPSILSNFRCTPSLTFIAVQETYILSSSWATYERSKRPISIHTSMTIIKTLTLSLPSYRDIYYRSLSPPSPKPNQTFPQELPPRQFSANIPFYLFGFSTFTLETPRRHDRVLPASPLFTAPSVLFRLLASLPVHPPPEYILTLYPYPCCLPVSPCPCSFCFLFLQVKGKDT